MITYERQKDGTLKQVDSPPKRAELVEQRIYDRCIVRVGQLEAEKAVLEARIDELCAEVERLRKAKDMMHGDAFEIGAMLVKARDENAKLRMLVVWLLEYSNDLDSCEGCEVVDECETEENTDPYGFPIACVAYERIVAEAEALGIEVRHG